MTDLTTYVPDTSKYTDPADRLIALGLAMKSGREMQATANGGVVWADYPHERSISRMAIGMGNGNDYRAKPEPRVVWLVLDKNGYHCATSDSKEEAISSARHWDVTSSEDAPHSAVRFVESTDDQ